MIKSIIQTIAMTSVFVASCINAIGATNDLFVNKIGLTGDYTQSTVNMDSTFGKEVGEGGNDIRSGWWTWTAPDNGTVTITTEGSDSFSKALYVYYGNELTSLKYIVSEGFSRSPYVTLPVTSGSVYQIKVGSAYSNDNGKILLTISLDAESSINTLPIQGRSDVNNDNFSDAIQLNGTFTTSIQYLSYCTTETFEPGLGYHSVWYEWTAPASGLLTISTEGSDSNSRYLYCYIGDELRSLKTVAYDGPHSYPEIVVPVVVGTTYKIKTSLTYDESSSLVITLSLDTNSYVNQLSFQDLATVGNNNFRDRKSITGYNVSVVCHTHDYNTEALEPGTGYRSAWYSWTAPASGTYSVSVLGSSEDILPYVYTGSAINQLQAVYTPSGNRQNPVFSFDATANTTYSFRLSCVYNVGATMVVTLSKSGTSTTPIITTWLTQCGQVGHALSVQLEATNSPTSYTASGLPTGLALNEQTGLISGTPQIPGEFTVNLKVAKGNEYSRSVMLIKIADKSKDMPYATGWIYTQDMGWLWTDSTYYPYIYRDSYKGWIYYVQNSHNPRLFLNVKTHTQEEVP